MLHPDNEMQVGDNKNLRIAITRSPWREDKNEPSFSLALPAKTRMLPHVSRPTAIV